MHDVSTRIQCGCNQKQPPQDKPLREYYDFSKTWWNIKAEWPGVESVTPLHEYLISLYTSLFWHKPKVAESNTELHFDKDMRNLRQV